MMMKYSGLDSVLTVGYIMLNCVMMLLMTGYALLSAGAFPFVQAITLLIGDVVVGVTIAGYEAVTMRRSRKDE